MTHFVTAAVLLLYQPLNKHTWLTQVSIYGVSQYPGEQVEKDGHWHIHSDHKWQSSLHSWLGWNCFPFCSEKTRESPSFCFLVSAGRILHSSAADSMNIVKHSERRSMFKVIQTLSKWVIGSIIRPQIKVWRTSEHAETSFFFTSDVTTETQIHHRATKKKKNNKNTRKRRNSWW